jgi:hypothetical protein
LVAYSERFHHDSLAECHSLVGFVKYKLNDCHSARGHLEFAEQLLAQSANPLRHREVVRLLALVSAEMNDTNATRFWLSVL